jgi:tetratricopeptide (TPR) repeat protein/DNA-binding SARP family transcriptional activator
MKVETTSIMSTNHAASEVMLPSDELAALLPSGWPLELPLARVRTCGTLTVEVLVDLHPEPDGRLQAVYGPPAASLFSIKGMTTSLVLLALLASQPGGFASKDFLIQTLAHLRQSTVLDEENDWEDVEPLARLDNVVSLLRKLLYPPKLLTFSGANRLRKHLARFVRATQDSGPGYRLAGFPLLWLDVEAMETYVARARQLEARGEDGLEEWQAAYQIGMRGAFLDHEPYSDWADWRRGRVTDLLWQSVDAQWKRAASWNEGTNGREAALRLLLEFWQAHMTNEDAFRSLVELLRKQERFGQAEECYRQLCSALDREGHLPQKRTQETMTFLHLARDRQEGHQQMPVVTSSSSRSWVAGGTAVHLDEETSQGDFAASGNRVEAPPILPETQHLIGREAWLRGVSQMVQAFPAKKLVILQGPIGVGKSSELARLAYHFQYAERSSYRVIWLSLPTAEWSSGPETTLDVLLGTLVSECGIASFPSEAPRERLIAAFLAHLRQQSRPTVMLLDNAECLLEENGVLAPCWEAFLTRFVRSRHQATFLLATKEWHGWSGRESLFVAETFVPPLSPDESVCLLQRLGLEVVPTELLQTVGIQVAGIPLLLEWIAKLVADPLLLDDWAGFEESEAILQVSTTQGSIAERLRRLLSDPSLLGEHLASRLAPLLQRILEKHLSDEARLVLARLAVATVPLGKPALQLLCPRPRLLKELRDTSLLAAYTNRVQLLPVVALTVRQQLSSVQRREIEDLVIQAYTRWLDDGHLEMREAGSVVTELTVLLLMHHRLLDAAQLLIRYGWLSFKLGHGPHLAIIARDELQRFDWHSTGENECAALVLLQLLFPLLGKPVEARKHVDYQCIRDGLHTGKIVLQTAIDRYVTHLLLSDAMSKVHFEEAQGILDAYRARVAARQTVNLDRDPALLMEQAFFFGRWCEYLEEQGERQQARTVREQAITLYKQRAALPPSSEKKSSLSKDLHKNTLAYCFCSLGYHLNRAGRYEEALQVTERAIALQEQGYVYRSTLAASYGEKSQILMAFGRFQEALLFDEKAMAEIQRWADAGDGVSQSEVPIYQVNRGRLYLRLGRVNEAEQVLQEALPRISAQRRKYRMFAHEALEEIKQWRQKSRAPEHQLDWRWAGRFRELIAHDSFWWLTWAGPFTEEEQQAWNRLFALPLDETTKEQLGTLMKESRERELKVALEEQRDPRLQYPAIAIEDVRYRINALLQLDMDIQQQEPNIIVRRLYQGAIEEDVDYLRLIEATYEGNTERFWECNLRVFPYPTADEMKYALAYVKRIIHQGLASPETAAISLHIQEFLHTRLHLSSDLTEDDIAMSYEIQQTSLNNSPEPQRRLAVQTVKRFFETILRESGYDEWQVVIDPNATGARIEQGLHVMFLPDQQFTLEKIKHLLMHELAGHTARIMAGEHSLLGLLGIHTKNYMPTEEGLALYYERQEELRHGRRFDDAGIRLITLGIGLASGVMTPPQTFLSVVILFEALASLRMLLKRPHTEKQKVQTQARAYALSLGLRIYRGVPDLECPGVCFLQDAMYLRGIRLIEQTATEDKMVLDRLAVGVCALEQLPDLQELGIVAPPQALRKLATASDLDAYILSFDVPEERCDEEE